MAAQKLSRRKKIANENSSKIKKYFQKAPKRAFWEITKTVFKEEKNACVLTYLEKNEDEKKRYF